MTSATLLNARRLLLIQYACRLPARSPSFSWPSAEHLVSVQGNLVEDFLSGRWCDPGPTTYQKSFFKELLARLEAGVQAWNEALPEEERDARAAEVDEAILEHYAELMSVGGSTSANLFSSAPPPADKVTYLFPRSGSALSALERSDAVSQEAELFQGWCSVVLHEEGAAISQGTTGLKTWEACLQLSRHVVCNPTLVARSRVLELGSGVGLLGMAVGMLQEESGSLPSSGGAEPGGSVCMTDMEGVVLDRLRETLSSNGIFSSSHIRAEPLNWLDVSSDLHDLSPGREASEATSLIVDDVRPDVILAADVVFDPSICPALADVLYLALTWPRRVGGWSDGVRGMPVAYVASTVRNQETYDGFLSCLREHDLELQHVPLSSNRGASHRLPLFPSAHDVTTGGEVRLLRISAPAGGEVLPAGTG